VLKRVKSAGNVLITPPGVVKTGEDLPPAKDGTLVVAVGDFYAQKDYPTMLRAFARLRAHKKDARLLIMGRAVDAGVRDGVLALVRELKLGDAVTMTGAVPHAMLMKTLAKADVYISTSLAESVQIPLLEAMALGVPVVAAKAPHSEEFVGEAGVLVDVAKGGDIPAAFGMALFGVLENPAIAASLARMGREKAAGYTWEATGRVLVEGVKKAIGIRQ
jgi:glycosyltransferase involved in cell wall biosynthesis